MEESKGSYSYLGAREGFPENLVLAVILGVSATMRTALGLWHLSFPYVSRNIYRFSCMPSEGALRGLY